MSESIFLKIILVFGIAGAVEVGLLRFFQRDLLSNDLRREHRYENMAEYGRSLAREVQVPVDSRKIHELAARLHLKVRIEDGVGNDVEKFTSSPDVPDFSAVDRAMSSRPAWSDRDRNARVGRFGDYLAIEVLQSDHQRYLFLLESENALDAHPELLLILVGCLLAILSLCYFAIRAILSPLNEIERAVKQVALGNLETEVHVKTRDELGRLGRSFNAMIQRVRSMISSKEQLLLDVSHEFRSPLTRIKVAMELQGEGARTSILRSLKDLEIMLSELLESARLNDSQGRLRLERVDLIELISELVHTYAEHKPGLKLHSQAENIFSLVDPGRILIALRNLIENAQKYSASQDRPVELAVEALEGQRVRIAIRDHGVGIPREDLDFVFEPFYRVDRSRVKATGGYGLGLALVQKIVIAHRGVISVQSEHGRGSTFVIELPTDHPEREAAIPRAGR